MRAGSAAGARSCHAPRTSWHCNSCCRGQNDLQQRNEKNWARREHVGCHRAARSSCLCAAHLTRCCARSSEHTRLQTTHADRHMRQAGVEWEVAWALPKSVACVAWRQPSLHATRQCQGRKNFRKGQVATNSRLTQRVRADCTTHMQLALDEGRVQHAKLLCCCALVWRVRGRSQ